MNTSDGTIVNLLKKHTIKDAIVLLKNAWGEILASCLVTSWKNLLQFDNDEYEVDDLLPLSKHGLFIVDWLIQEIHI